MGCLIQCVMMLQGCAPPPNIHLRSLNTHLDIEARLVIYPTEVVASREQAIGVSSFGFGGTIGHAVLEGGGPAAQTSGTDHMSNDGGIMGSLTSEVETPENRLDALSSMLDNQAKHVISD